MSFVQLVLFLPLLGGDGVRSRSIRAGVFEYPVSPGCLLASGFSVSKGCNDDPVMQPIRSCENASPDEACYWSDQDYRVSEYTTDVRTSDDYLDLTHSVINAEGAGFGQSASASFSYMKESKVSEKSLSFFIGASGKPETKMIRNSRDMKLTDAAKELLITAPREFLQQHGVGYIRSISYGGSFLGSVTLNSMETGDEQELEAFVGLSVTEGFFSASGSSKFQKIVSESNSKVSVFISAKWVGGSSGITQDYGTPEKLSLMFLKWNQSFREHPAPLTIRWSRWIHSKEVEAILDDMSPEDRVLFEPGIDSSILREITEENVMVTLTETSVKQALQWKEVKSNTSAVSCLQTLELAVTTQTKVIDTLDDTGINQISQNKSWFQATSLHDRYLACVEGIEPKVE